MGGVLEGMVLLLLALDGCRIGETPMDLLRVAREQRTTFPHTVAHGNNIVEPLVLVLVHMLGALPAHVYTHPLHHTHRVGVYLGRRCARAINLYAIATQVPHDGLRHL